MSIPASAVARYRPVLSDVDGAVRYRTRLVLAATHVKLSMAS